jgi:murein DD-endopeptidase MepM/ murein hydrolase activator NlpD
LVQTEPFNFGSGTLQLQPFVYTRSGSAKKYNLRIGRNLSRFLSDPLDGAKFDLTLPFRNPRVALSDKSALLRIGGNASTWHTAVDLDITGNTKRGFEVLAPADGIVEGNANSTTMALKHRATNGQEFLTLWSHIDRASKSHLHVGDRVTRGQVIGRIPDVPSNEYKHLHVAIAVKGPARVINGLSVPELWYLIDPFGVYDYRRNKGSATNYNYLPNNTLEKPVRGIRHAYVWRTNPPIGSLLLREDCIKFSPNTARVIPLDGKRYRIMAGRTSLFVFPNRTEANQTLRLIRQYRINSSCFIGRPKASFQYLLTNGKSPSGSVKGEDCIGFSPPSLVITSISNGKYRLSSGRSSMFTFPNMLEAGNALSLIGKYGFKRTCFVGRPNPSLQYLRR